MAEVETVTLGQELNVPRAPENYTQVTGIYAVQVTPQFLNAPDNVQYAFSRVISRMLEEAEPQQQELRFFRML